MNKLTDIKSDYFTWETEGKLKLYYSHFNTTHNVFNKEYDEYEISFNDFEDMLYVSIFKTMVGENIKVIDKIWLEELIAGDEHLVNEELFDDVVYIYNNCSMAFILDVLVTIFQKPFGKIYWN